MDGERHRAEVAVRADFSGIRYAQCWEDADVLLEALAIRPGDRCLSIASGGENTLSMLASGPAQVIAVDLAPAQLTLLELKCAAIRLLPHDDALALVGLSPSPDRRALYRRARPALSPAAAAYWDARPDAVGAGVCNHGRFERYLAIFRHVVLPLVHTRAEVDALLAPRDPPARREYYDRVWNSRRWRALTRLFWSRPVMGRLGRDPAFFRYVEDDVAAAIDRRVEHALTAGDPAANPYLHYIARGRYAGRLPHAWRPENFDPIRRNLDALELRLASIEEALAQAADRSIDRFNLSDVFEYVSTSASERMFDDITRSGRPGGRVAYWNMMVPRHPPARLAARLVALDAESTRLHARANTFFYRAFRVDALAAGPP